MTKSRKLTKTAPRVREGGPGWKGDGRDKERSDRAWAKRRRRAQRNLANEARRRMGRES
jgi:hypothetical protein